MEGLPLCGVCAGVKASGHMLLAGGCFRDGDGYRPGYVWCWFRTQPYDHGALVEEIREIRPERLSLGFPGGGRCWGEKLVDVDAEYPLFRLWEIRIQLRVGVLPESVQGRLGGSARTEPIDHSLDPAVKLYNAARVGEGERERGREGERERGREGVRE